MVGDRERFLGGGFDGYLRKPISVREFPGQVRGHLRGGWLTAPTILAVDDAPQNTRLLEAVLSAQGYDVVCRVVGAGGARAGQRSSCRTSSCSTSRCRE